MGEGGVQLKRDKPISAGGFLIHRAEYIRGHPNVLQSKVVVDVAWLDLAGGGEVVYCVVVIRSMAYRPVEDRWIRRDPGHGVLTSQPIQVAARDHFSSQEVEPNALPGASQLFKCVHSLVLSDECPSRRPQGRPAIAANRAITNEAAKISCASYVLGSEPVDDRDRQLPDACQGRADTLVQAVIEREIRVWNCDHSHVRRERGANPVAGILDGHACLRRHAETVRGTPIDIRSGLAPLHLLGRNADSN